MTKARINFLQFDIGTPDSPEAVMLELELGIEDAWRYPTRLWCWAATHRSRGNVADIPAFLIARVCRFAGDPDVLVAALRSTGYLLDNGDLAGWESRYGKLIKKADEDLARKRTARTSDGLPTDVHRTAPVEDRKGEKRKEDREGERAAPPPAPTPLMADEVMPPDGPAERAEARRSNAVVQSSLRDHRGRAAAAGAILGRPQSVDELLALKVKDLPDGRMITAPEDGRPLREVRAERYPTLDGKGTPKRKTVAEFAEVLWPYMVNRPWSLDGASFLSWLASKMAEEAEKARRAWEAQGGATASDPDRIAAKKRHIHLQGMGRDLPPFPTWYDERWCKGLDRRDFEDADPPPQGPSGGTRPSGQTHALSTSLPPTADPFAAPGVDLTAKAPNLMAMVEEANRRRPRSPEQET